MQECKGNESYARVFLKLYFMSVYIYTRVCIYTYLRTGKLVFITYIFYPIPRILFCARNESYKRVPSTPETMGRGAVRPPLPWLFALYLKYFRISLRNQ